MNKPQYNPGYQKPARPGVYIRKYPGYTIDHFCKWDGKQWSTGKKTREEAVNTKIGDWYGYPEIPWREDHTEWFEGKTTCPDKPGVYEITVNGHNRNYFSYWNGDRWGYRGTHIHSANSHRQLKATGPVHQWRGFNSCQEV